MIPKEILKKVRHIEIRTRHMVDDLFAGQYHSAFKGQGMEFQEVRKYVPGDDIRDIDWNVTARMNEPFVKKFREERELTMMLIVDISASNQFGSSGMLKKDLAAEIAAVLAFAAIKNNDRVGLILHTSEVEHYVPPQKGLRHVLRVVSDVLNFKPQNTGTALGPALDYLNKLKVRKTVLFMIGDFMLPRTYERELRVTARKHDVTAIVIGDQREKQWPKVGLIEWEDAETGKRYLVDTSDNATRQRLEATFTHRRTELIDMLRRMNMDSMQVNAHEPYEREFIKFFKTRAHRLATT